MEPAAHQSEAAQSEAAQRETALASFLALYDSNSTVARACVKVGELEPAVVTTMAADVPCPTLPTHDYIEDVEARWQLLDEFRRRCTDAALPTIVKLNATALAVFMAAPLPILEARVRGVGDFATAMRALNEFSEIPVFAIKYFLAKGGAKPRALSSATSSAVATPTRPTIVAPMPQVPQPQLKRKASASPEDSEQLHKAKATRSAHTRSASDSQVQAPPATTSKPPTTPTPKTATQTGSMPSSPVPAATPSSAPDRRSRAAALAAKARDGNACVLSGLCDPEAAHIFPFFAASNKEARVSIDLLLMFWGAEKLAAWRALCEDRGVTESPKNLLSLNQQLHAWWGAARFGLKPISATENVVVVQFHWFPRSSYKPNDRIAWGSRDEAIGRLCGGNASGVQGWNDNNDNKDNNGAEPILAHRASGLPIRTGQLFSIRADSAAELPSMELLELQWNLLRVTAMSGAADVSDAYYDMPEPDSDADSAEYEDNSRALSPLSEGSASGDLGLEQDAAFP